MYRVLLVDDEPIILKGLRETIEWDSLDLELCGEASDGRQALELVRSLRPHIVITDIKMPQMDGIELIRCIKQENSATKIIILSGFSDYAYLKEAIHLGVDSYLLKPIDNDELVSNLRDMAENLDRQIYEETQLYQGSELLLTNTLNRLVTNSISAEEFDEKCSFLGVSLAAERFVCALCVTDEASAVEFSTDRRLAAIAVQNICRDLAGDRAYTFLDSAGRVVLLFLLADAGEIRPPLQDIFESIHRHTQQALGFSLLIGAGTVETDKSGIFHSYQTALQSLDYSVFYQNKGVIWYESTAALQPVGKAVALDEEKLQTCIREGDRRGLQAMISETFEQLCFDNAVAVTYAQNFTMQLAVKIMELFGAMEVVPFSVGESHFNYAALLKYYLPQDFQNWLFALCDQLFAERESLHGENSTVVSQVLAFVDAHYSEGFTLKQVACQCHINTSYLGQVFKKETGTSFTDYVNSYRVKKAKKLLQSSTQKVYEVAQAVGFTDYHYFLKIFKKVTGSKPTEIRS